MSFPKLADETRSSCFEALFSNSASKPHKREVQPINDLYPLLSLRPTFLPKTSQKTIVWLAERFFKLK